MPSIKRAIVLASVTAFIALTPLAASAHDEVIATSPEANATVEAGKISASVTFGEDIMKTPDNEGEVIQVLGPDGNGSQVDYAYGCKDVNGAVLSVPVFLDQPGKYTVNYRSVSSDGHPTEGSYDFTLTNTSGYRVGTAVQVCTPTVIAAPPVYGVHKTDNTITDNIGYIAGSLAVLAGAAVAVAARRR